MLDLPEDVYAQAVQMFAEYCERQREIDQHMRSGRKGKMPPSRVEVGPKPSEPLELPEERIAARAAPERRPEGVAVNPRTGFEEVASTRSDGTVVRHRKIEEGERFLWTLVGRPPKSWEGKVDV